MNKILVFFLTFICISVVTVRARYFGGVANEGFKSIPFTGSRVYQNWKQFNGLDKRFRFDGSDGFGHANNRFVDWSQIIGSPRTKKDFDTSLSDRFGLYRYPIGKQRMDLNPSDFSKKSTSDNEQNGA